MLMATKMLPRFTVEQMISFSWQYLVPAGFIGIIVYLVIVLKHSWI
jgi:NADH:ubiquinone oxidoreductase subunit H